MSLPRPALRPLAAFRLTPATTRSKSKMAKVPTLTVRLTQDVPKFGRAGSIVAVARGRMRNLWFPRRQADYLGRAEARTARVAERDVNFRPDLVRAGVAAKRGAEIELLSPSQTLALLEAHLPTSLQFSRALTGADGRTIQGSVTTGDVASALRAIMSAQTGEAAADAGRVVVTPEMVRFVDLPEGADKLKELGAYAVEIGAKGAAAVVRRDVVVLRH
ncbi:hypothetical protein EDC01DRAFT_783587 [Geopyxis carbonaria]|nr:hypothetical protein EDC01DRAFT_783587 [Geopyxis carbonaria]